mmetsp:Transcript_1632/g.5008  ORF Transcript_1632/g.5008 Transcript_1632/m.5008 type:complete len:763 (-) Transcript_1632:58-2346(-)
MEPARRMDDESKRMVEALDRNGDGFIERDELRQLLFQLGISRDVTAIFSISDPDHDGYIRIEDFVEWLLEDAPQSAARQLKVYPRSKKSTDEACETEPECTAKILNCSQWFAEAMAEAGVTHVYGGHGGALVPMVNAVCEHPKLTWICTRNEANASLMAAAHAKLTGGLACCMATSGPGATNLTTGLLEAELDQCSVVCITGLKPRQGLGYSEFQDVNQSRLFAGGGIGFSVNVASAEAFVPLLRNGVAKAITTHCCVHLAVPVDVQAASCPVPYMPLASVETLHQMRALCADASQLNAVASELHEATKSGQGKVLIAVGNRCVAAGPEILKLAERLHSPILTRLDAKGCCDESHPLVWGVMGVHGKPGLEASARLIESCELVLAFGVHDYSVLLCNQAGLQVRPMIQFEPDATMPLTSNAQYQALHTVIGYTPWAIGAILDRLKTFGRNSIMPAASFRKSLRHMSLHSKGNMQAALLAAVPEIESRRNSNISVATEDLNAELKSQPESKSLSKTEPEETGSAPSDYWELLHNARKQKSWAEIRASKDFIHAGRYEVHESDSYKHCHPAKVFEEMNKHFGPSDVLCVDTGDVTLWAGLCAVLAKGQRTLSSERLGTMGYSLCAGLVASLVREQNGRGVVVAGDGGIQMTINELGTVCQVFHSSDVKYRLIIVIFDNAMLGRVHFGFKGALGCDLGPSPDFVGLAKSYGGDGALLAEPSELQGVVKKAFNSDGLYIIHALTDPSIKADMQAFKDKSIQMMASG